MLTLYNFEICMSISIGTTEIIENPDVTFSKSYLDFRKGFYLTTYQKQAEKWALRKALRKQKSAIQMGIWRGNMAKKKIPTVEELREYIEKEKAYYYCYALISLSDYRQEDCEKLLWDTINYFIEKDKDRGSLLLRNMKVLEHTRPFLTPMKEKLEEAQNISFLK